MADSTPQSVLVTGASSGIGLDCALFLDRQGFKVYAGYRKPEDAELLKQRASQNLVPVQLDVTRPETITPVIETIGQAGSALYGLVNNAGVVVAGPLEILNLDDLRYQFEVNVMGVMAVTQACLPLLRESRGRVVNIGSISGLLASPFIGPYCASKYALEALTDALRMELCPWGIQVAIIEPGSIQTNIWSRSRHDAETRAEAWPSDGIQLYRQALERMQEVTRKSELKALPVERVTEAIYHALTAKKPKARYLIGRTAKVRAILRFLPNPVLDRLTLGFMGLPTAKP